MDARCASADSAHRGYFAALIGRRGHIARGPPEICRRARERAERRRRQTRLHTHGWVGKRPLAAGTHGREISFVSMRQRWRSGCRQPLVSALR